ncbi:MAG: hypothetical protein CM1200mP9_08090 [Gammaproteobacteria bacterium]|nr:MAG: hypothetical protein CM1200mP9_08090 [Gammaproteobacteria bacterium]
MRLKTCQDQYRVATGGEADEVVGPPSIWRDLPVVIRRGL